ncbi:MAG: TerC family protein [Myxococcales bacterium]|nr:TerC family protein [Myxococcales bacterium]
MSSVLLWSGFIVLVLGLIAIDLGVHRNQHAAMPPRSALAWSALWIGVALAFGLFVWAHRGSDDAIAYYTGYIIEKSLSIDNLFIFLLVFRQFGVPTGEQHRVLTWGIFGALVFRALLIVAGIDLIHRFHFVMYIFGAFLLYTGIRTLWPSKKKATTPIEEQLVVRLFRRIVPIEPTFDGGRFFTRKSGRRAGTLLLLVLFVIEMSDIFFAVDSIPAILAISDDPFIVFSSNILALLGLRALYFAVSDLLGRLRYLHYGLGAILIVIGLKMGLADVVKISPLISLAVTVGILALTIGASLWTRPPEAPRTVESST